MSCELCFNILGVDNSANQHQNIAINTLMGKLSGLSVSYFLVGISHSFMQRQFMCNEP